MKKILLGTTALVAASFAATAAIAAPEVKLTGFMDFQAGFVSQETDGWGSSPGGPSVAVERGFGFRTDTEIAITASDKLDNGLAWKVKIELEADADASNGTANDNADEVSIVFSGSWGQLTLGNEDGPVDLAKGGNAMLSGQGANGAKGYAGWTDTKSFSHGMSAKFGDIANTSDATKVMYYTPVINGFQAGISYSAGSTENGRARSTDDGASSLTGFENYWEVGAAYDMQVNSDLKLGAAVIASSAKALNNKVTEVAAVDDIKSWGASMAAEYGNWKASVAYSTDGKGGQAKNISNANVSSYGGAVMYTEGPVSIGASYLHGTAGANAGQSQTSTTLSRISDTADFTADVFTLGARYTLGAGLALYAESWYYKHDSDGQRSSSENSAMGLLIGTAATF